MKLRPMERAALARLAELHAKYPSNDYGFHARSLGASEAAAARRMERVGWVKVDRQAANCFRYALTETGKARAQGEMP